MRCKEIYYYTNGLEGFKEYNEMNDKKIKEFYEYYLKQMKYQVVDGSFGQVPLFITKPVDMELYEIKNNGKKYISSRRSKCH